MTKLSLIIFLFLTSSIAYSEEGFLNFGNQNFANEKVFESKWVFKLGLDYSAYRTKLPEYKGMHDSIKEGEIEDVVGLGVGFGRDFYLGAGFSTTLGFGLTYAKTLQQEIGGADGLDVDVASTRKSHLITMGEVQGSINYMFDNKTVDIQPFIEASFGVGRTELDYEYKRAPIENAEGAEFYNVSSEEFYNVAKASIGMNIISFNGLVTYIKVTAAKLFIHERNIKGNSNVAGTLDVKNLNSNDDKLKEEVSITQASLGLGYMF